jgi:hypothetical protein
MSNILNFNITGGLAPYEVELVGSGIPKQTFDSSGYKSIADVPNGVYMLNITDSNLCVFEQEIFVDPFVTTTTTTQTPGNSIVIGNVQDSFLIFNPEGTNRNSEFTGFPDPNIVTLFLWFKTFDGVPLDEQVSFNYTINAPEIYEDGGSLFIFNLLSDQIHAEVIESISGPTPNLTGTILLKPGFIETYFQYTYLKGAVDPDFFIDITSPAYAYGTNLIYTGVPTRDDAGTTYGVFDPVEGNRIIITYSDSPTAVGGVTWGWTPIGLANLT